MHASGENWRLGFTDLRKCKRYSQNVSKTIAKWLFPMSDVLQLKLVPSLAKHANEHDRDSDIT